MDAKNQQVVKDGRERVARYVSWTEFSQILEHASRLQMLDSASPVASARSPDRPPGRPMDTDRSASSLAPPPSPFTDASQRSCSSSTVPSACLPPLAKRACAVLSRLRRLQDPSCSSRALRRVASVIKWDRAQFQLRWSCLAGFRKSMGKNTGGV